MTPRTARLLLVLLLAVLAPVGLLAGCRSSPSVGVAARRSTPAGTPPAGPSPQRHTPSQSPSQSPSQPPSQSPTPRSAPSQSPTPQRTGHSPTPPPATVAGLLTGIVGAVDTDNRSAFQALVSGRDPGFPRTAEMIFHNLVVIHPADLALRATGARRDVSASRAGSLGRNAYAVQVRVTWSVPGDRAPSDQQVWMTVVRSGTAFRWAGIADGPAGLRQTPLWWLEPVRYAHSGAATVITGAGVNTTYWITAGNTAVAKDAHLLPGSGWNHKLVIIVPSSEALMEQSLGVAKGSDAALAAISWPDGSEPASAPVRIMINPAGQPSALSTAIVLAHETVHVATRSPTSPAPSWLVEGFADDIAYRGYPQGMQPAAAGLLAEVRRSGPPSTLPDDDQFSAGHPDLNRSYAEGWLACRYLGERFGDQRLWRFYEAVDTSRDGSVSQPLHSVFGIDEHQFLTGWQHYLRSAAETGRI